MNVLPETTRKTKKNTHTQRTETINICEGKNIKKTTGVSIKET